MEDIRYWIELSRHLQTRLNELEEDYKDLLDEAVELLDERFELKAKIKRLEEESLNNLKQENEQLKEEILRWQKAYSRQYQINENKGYNKKEEQYRQTLREIKDISEKFVKNVSEECINITPMFLVHKEILQKITELEEAKK